MGEDQDLQTAQRNERRRQRYATDQDYRKRCIATTRKNYRRNGHMENDVSCLGNLGTLSAYGSKRKVPGLNKSPRVTFNVEEIASAMNRHRAVAHRWIRNELFPAPRWGYYTLPQARVIVRAMGELQKETPYYRRDHSELRGQLFAAMEV